MGKWEQISLFWQSSESSQRHWEHTKNVYWTRLRPKMVIVKTDESDGDNMIILYMYDSSYSTGTVL